MIAEFVPPARICSSEDRVYPLAQLRPGLGNRRKMDTEKPNSVEMGAHRRKAPAPIRAGFAGVDASAKRSLPTSTCSSEDRLRIRAQLRLGSGNRRKTNTEEPNSVEKVAHRRKAPAPI